MPRLISTGLTKAVAAGMHHVYVSTGSYPETVTINSTNQGISIHGGYRRSSNWLRDGTRATVSGPRTGVLRVSGVTTATVVEYVQFVAASASVSSTSSEAVVVTSSTG